MNKNKIRNKKWYNNAVAILIGVVGYVVLTHLGPISKAVGTFVGFFKPVILGCVVAYLVNPLAELIQRELLKGVKRDNLRWYLSIIVGMAAVLLLLLLLLLMLIPQLIESVGLLIGNMDGYIKSLQQMVENMNIGGIDVGSSLEEFLNVSFSAAVLLKLTSPLQP